jgi:uncharacterized membrane protein YkoI
MTHRYALAAVMLAAFALPAAAQQTTPSDTSNKTTTTTSNGAVTDTSKATTTINPNGAPSNGAQVTATPQPSAGPATTPPTESTQQATGTPPATEVAPSSGAMPATGAAKSGVSPTSGAAEGQVTPHAAAKVDIKVAESLANTVKISGDSAFAIARSAPDAGDISSADLEMKEGRLVYEIKMVHGKNGASEVHVDAMTGELIKDKKYGGVKAIDTHAAESQKLQNAKADSANTKKP